MKKCIFLAVLFIILCSSAVNATNYYMKPTGNNASAGTSAALAWATLGRASGSMYAGDTLFVLGGCYHAIDDSASMDERQSFISVRSGTATHPIVIKAYGDSIAYFTNTGGVYSTTYLTITGEDYIVMDGWSHLQKTDSLYIVLEGHKPLNAKGVQRAIEIGGSVADPATGIKITGVEMNGNFPPNAIVQNPFNLAYGVRPVTEGGYLLRGVNIAWGECDTIISCYIHHIFWPTGDIPPGDGSNRAQGDAWSIFIDGGSKRIYVARNFLYNAGHSLIIMEQRGTTYPDYPNQPMYCKIVNNRLYNFWGAGLYVNINPEYNLIEGNIVCHAGETTTKTKDGMTVEGSNNTIRNNVVYAPHVSGVAWSIVGELAVGGQACRRSYNNYMYNNMIFGCDGVSFHMQARNDDSYSCADAAAENNKIYNNIFYGSIGSTDNTSQRRPELLFFFACASNAHNWIYPDASGTSPATTNFGNNVFKNNIIRKSKTTCPDNQVPWSEMIWFDGDDAYSNDNFQFSLPAAAAASPTAFSGNLELDPLITSEFPDAVGLWSDWWHIKSNSPCFDAGTTSIVDTIGDYVESLYPGYGWSSLPYVGAAPDIGPYELGVSTGTPTCTVSPTTITFGTYPIGDSTGVDSFVVINSGDGWLNGTFTLNGCGTLGLMENFSITENGGTFSVAPGDSIWVMVQFNPQSGGLKTCTIETDNVLCGDITLIGGACLVTPSTINFGDVRVGECSSTQTLTLKNTGTGTITGTVSGTDPDFSITAGTGAFSLTAGQEKVVSIKFCPLSSGIKAFGVNLGGAFGLSGVSFTVSSTSIITNFTTSEDASCIVFGQLYDEDNPDNPEFESWYAGLTRHGTTHQHLKEGLLPSTKYAIQIRSYNAAGLNVWAPNSAGYYIVETSDEVNNGGGIKGTNPDRIYPIYQDGE
jgi:hypothetical protein